VSENWLDRYQRLLKAKDYPGALALLRQQTEPVAWRCKDYGDGWIYYRYRQQAFDYAESTGCLIQGLVPVDLPQPGA
jgi:hypothetical protein